MAMSVKRRCEAPVAEKQCLPGSFPCRHAPPPVNTQQASLLRREAIEHRWVVRLLDQAWWTHEGVADAGVGGAYSSTGETAVLAGAFSDRIARRASAARVVTLNLPDVISGADLRRQTCVEVLLTRHVTLPNGICVRLRIGATLLRGFHAPRILGPAGCACSDRQAQQHAEQNQQPRHRTVHGILDGEFTAQDRTALAGRNRPRTGISHTLRKAQHGTPVPHQVRVSDLRQTMTRLPDTVCAVFGQTPQECGPNRNILVVPSDVVSSQLRLLGGSWSQRAELSP